MPEGRLAGALLALVLGLAGCGGGGDANDGAGRADRSRTRADADARRGDPRRGRRGGRADRARVGGHAAPRPRPRRRRVLRDPQPRLQRHGPDQARVARGGRVLQPHAALRGQPDRHGARAARLPDRHVPAHRAPRPGSAAAGTGETARTAFRVRDAHITDWLRVQDIESAPETLSAPSGGRPGSRRSAASRRSSGRSRTRSGPSRSWGRRRTRPRRTRSSSSALRSWRGGACAGS